MVTGSGGRVGNAIAGHMGIGKVTFTGSTDIGKVVMTSAAQSNVKRVTLELGGKSPNIVFADADLDLATRIVHHGLFLNQGQTCCNGTRVFVEGKIYDQFIAKSKELAQKRVLGDPFDPITDQGPQIDEAQVKIISDYVESGIKEGAKLVCGK
ncbi:aldehyde dehydrogenase family protein [Oesophagostomum dentatum]|uniref:Aldehyde dehydrogenase family protein n=1 Tax=Oesophagostomum dentatum TaxID=61180 RepID=A0A0B1SHD2_OESDE|nr:aldehyde dehydrogenase family protein [Oesophagostomum dentatum]